MRSSTLIGTVVLSVTIHVGLGMGLFASAKQKVARRAIAVSVAEAKKKAEPPKPPPPKPVVRPAPRPVAKVAPVAAAPVSAPKAVAAPAPVATAVQMSNDDSPGGIAIPVRGPAAAAKPAVKVASVGPAPRQRRREEAGLGAGPQDVPCSEEPTKPEVVYRTEIEYTASARAEGIEGKLKIKLTVGADGSVVGAEVLASVSPELDAAAVASAKLWRFKPAMACGKPVAGGTYILARRFELGD